MTTENRLEVSLIDDWQFYVSARLTEPFYPKFDPAPFTRMLNEQLNLHDYGAGLDKFYFTFLVYRNDNGVHGPGIIVRRKTRSVEIAERIPGQEAFEATDQGTVQLMENALLRGIDRLLERRLHGPFDIERFKANIQGLFEEKDWYSKRQTEGLKSPES